ncbi:hypothetical protein NESM_000033800 [Novymonas esmeraldas]|uniref:Uncharacterized protein n=1 Tax=Novymonas esmeraldas TaxID=1808958 RepID=A0AAW0F3N7_9TRYP
MGVPDFVKFIARSSPGALCRLPKGGAASDPLIFDFILIDATNAAQTLGLEALRAFLDPSHLVARSAIIFAVDSQRDRSGTARAHRHALVRIGDLDVHVQRLCGQLTDTYRAHQASASKRGAYNPFVLTSGRGVAGEADYKLLDLQRSLVTCAVASGATVLPTFLFVSEDSDVLCGALCGPAPQQVSIATRLQDVLFEPSVLRLDRVLAYVASCTDAFYAENERAAAAAAAAAMSAAAERNAAKARRASTAGAASAPSPGEAVAQDGDDDVELSVQDTAVAAAPQETDVVRRRKQDGPMIATGVRIELTDSSSDDDDDEQGRAPTAAGAAAVAPAATSTGHHPSVDAAPTETELLAATITRTSCVDMVFLLMIVMGNAVNVPSLVRGATKVDVGSCWQAYCKHKYKNLSAAEAETGRTLLSPSITTHSTDKGSLVLNCRLLHAILDAVHYADAEPRPPGEEEKSRAIAYLSNAVYSTLRYVVGCNLERTPKLQQTFLDSRPLSETAAVLPSLSAVMWVLGQDTTRTFSFPLHGLTKRELLTAAAGGASAAAKATADTPTRLAPHGTGAPRNGAAAGAGDLDVGDHLIAPTASNAWAVRGARSTAVSLTTLMHAFSSGAAGTPPSTGARPAPLPSITEMLKKSLQVVSPGTLAKANVFAYLTTVWTYALGLGVRHVATLTKAAASVAKAEGGESSFTSLQPAAAATVKGAKAGGATAAKAAGGQYVYSFELRRMAPVLHAPADAAPQRGQQGAATGETPPAVTAPPSSQPSAAQQAIMAALGVSYEYSKAPQAPENVVHLPRAAMDEEDVAELQRLRKVAKKERALAASATAGLRSKEGGGGDNTGESAAGAGADAGAADGGSARRGKTKKESPKGKKRLGKRERLKLQKSEGKATAAVSSARTPSKTRGSGGGTSTTKASAS